MIVKLFKADKLLWLRIASEDKFDAIQISSKRKRCGVSMRAFLIIPAILTGLPLALEIFGRFVAEVEILFSVLVRLTI